jgi:hypothetical protein
MTMDSEFLEGGQGVTDAGQDVHQFDAPDISPEEYAEHTASRVASALEATKMFGVVEVKAGLGQVHIMGRVRREHERRWAENVIFPMLLTMEKSEDCNGFIGKQYILKEGKALDNLKYAWVISFASNDLRKSAADICTSFAAAIPRVEVTEAPLMGPSSPQSGGARSGRKGASPVY